ETTDGAGHTAAVDLQVVPGLVGLAAHIHLHAVDQLVEPAEGDREVPGGVRQGDGHRVGVVLLDGPGTDPPEQGTGLREPGELDVVRQHAVADVVDAPGEGVQRRHRAPLGRGQQPDAVGEVAGLLPGDGLAVTVGGEYRC